MTARGFSKTPTIQVPVCDRCTQGVMDATNPHMLGECRCECHEDHDA